MDVFVQRKIYKKVDRNMQRILPAYPLFVKDPFFSLWSNGERLNDSDVMFWTGAKKSVVGVLTIDGEEFIFLGRAEGIKSIEQTSLSVAAYTTDYQFENEKVHLRVRFVSPLPLNDKKLLSCPVCYMQYEIVKKIACETSISLALNGDVCYNVDGPTDKKLREKVFKLNHFETAYFGLKRQAPLSHAYDNCQADWGYWYVAGEECYVGEMPYESAKIKGDHVTWIKAQNKAESGNILIGFDDIVSISYFGEWLQGYYFKDGKTIINALEETWNNLSAIDEQLQQEDEKLQKATKEYGPAYRDVLYASLRQSIAAHKLVENKKGELLWTTNR